MDEDEEIEEECITVLGWSVEQVARSTIPEMYEALHQHRINVIPTLKAMSSGPSPLHLPPPLPSTTTSLPSDSSLIVIRIQCLRQRIEVKKRSLHSGGITEDDTHKLTRSMETDVRLLEENQMIVGKRLEVLTSLLHQKNQTLLVLDDLLRLTDPVQGLTVCVNNDTQHRKDVVDEIRVFNVERTALLPVKPNK
jgi:hypothetical protein